MFSFKKSGGAPPKAPTNAATTNYSKPIPVSAPSRMEGYQKSYPSMPFDNMQSKSKVAMFEDFTEQQEVQGYGLHGKSNEVSSNSGNGDDNDDDDFDEEYDDDEKEPSPFEKKSKGKRETRAPRIPRDTKPALIDINEFGPSFSEYISLRKAGAPEGAVLNLLKKNGVTSTPPGFERSQWDQKYLGKDLLQNIALVKNGSTDTALLSRMGITDDKMNIVISMLAECGSRLRKIKLSQNKFTSVGAQLLFSFISTAYSVEQVYLSGNKIGDGAVIYVAQTAASNYHLKTIDLQATGISDYGVKTLVTGLRSNSSLENLYLGRNRGITDASVPLIDELLRTSTIANKGSGRKFLDGTSISIDQQIRIKNMIGSSIAPKKELKKKKKGGNAEITPEIREMMERIKENGGECSLNRAKIMMTGPGRAGKSATVRSLKGQSFNPNLESTVGADASQTCTVTRSENVVNWEEKKVESAFAEHVAMFIKEDQDAKEAANAPQRRPSLLQRLRNSFSSKQQQTLSASSQNQPSAPPTQISPPSAPKLASPLQKSPQATSEVPKVALSPEPAPKSSEIQNNPPKKLGDQGETKNVTSTRNLLSNFLQQQPTPVKRENRDDKEVVKLPPSGTLSLKDDQEAVNVHTLELVAKSVSEQQGNDSSNIALSIWDLGGQEVFYTLHHLFLTKFAAYLCIFDMRHMISDDKQVREKSLEYTNFWLRSIQMHANGAPIFLVGTFKDQVPDDKQHRKINERLCYGLRLNSIAPTLVMNTKSKLVFWPIDNSKGAKGDPVIQQLRETIMDIVSKMSHIKMMVPLVWTRIYDKLMETKKRNMTLTDVIAISNKYGITDEQQVSAMLALFHQLGMLLHFNKTNELRDLVILEPQWIVDALTMVIRDFELHPYNDDLSSDLLMKLADDFMRLRNESIASVSLLYKLWKGEDKDSEIDYTRRKFLVSIMEQMTLSSPWRFGEELIFPDSSDNADDFMPMLPPPTQYIIPSNLRLFRGDDIEKKLMSQIKRRVETPIIDADDEVPLHLASYTPNCFIVDFSQSFLPIGFFDRLICLLVAFASACFQNSRPPIVAKGSVLMSFGMNIFRVDEDLQRSRIVVTAGDECDHQLLLRTVESMVGKLKDEVMGSLLKYRFVVAVWRNKGKKCCLVDIDRAREALVKKVERIWDIENDMVKSADVEKQWVISSAEVEAADRIKQISQKMTTGKTHHAFILHPGTELSNIVVTRMANDMGVYGVKSQYDVNSIDTIKKEIDSSMCVIVLLVEGLFQESNVEAALLYVSQMLKEKKSRVPLILLQEGREMMSTQSSGAMNPIIATSTNIEIRDMLENVDEPMSVKHRSHERVMFFNDLCAKIHKLCMSLVSSESSSGSNDESYLCFWSHYKAEAGITARLLHEKVEPRCRSRQDENPALFKDPRTFIDSDDLKDLRSLLEHVKKSRFLVAVLTKKYLTRPWCLAELHAALENNIPIIPINVIGGGYDFSEAKHYMETLTSETLNTAAGSDDTSVVLENLGINIEEFGKKLSSSLPNIIAISFNPLGGGRVMEAEIDTFIDRLMQ